MRQLAGVDRLYAVESWTRSGKPLYATAHVKPLLYVFRVLLTGIHLLRSGEIEANLRTLNTGAKLPYIEELIERKASGSEKERLSDGDVNFYRAEYDRLMASLVEAGEVSTLPDAPSSRPALNDLLLRLRGVTRR